MTRQASSFIGREAELRRVAHALRTGHVLLLGPRRFGKTSVMQEHLARCVPGETGLYMDVEPLGSPGDFVLSLARHMAESREAMDALLDAPLAAQLGFDGVRRAATAVERAERLEIAIDRLRPDLHERWASIGEDLIRAVARRSRAVIIAVDELPFMLDRMARHDHLDSARVMLSWLRSLRAEECLRNVRWIFGGSIGMDALAKNLGLSATLNDLERIYIGPMPAKEAAQLVAGWEATSRIRFGADLRRLILGVMQAPVPFFLKMFLGFLRDERRKLGRGLTRDDIQRVYNRDLLGPHMSVHLDPYVTRLEQYTPAAKSAAARSVLAALSIKGELTENEMRAVASRHFSSALDRAFADLLASLEGDYYLRRTGKTYQFTVRLLRDWWRRNVGEG